MSITASRPRAASGAGTARAGARLARAFVRLKANIARRAGDSPEAAARDARYALLFEAMEPGEVLVTAQHRDDQVETLLLQLFRGAGVAGLPRMPAIAPFGPGSIARPLLDVSRGEIEALARKARLQWIEDPSNADTRFSRNFLRQRLMPLIREHWPGVDKAMARSAAHMAEAAALAQRKGRARDLAASRGRRRALGDARCARCPWVAGAMRCAPSSRATAVEMPETSRLKEMSGPLLAARADAQPEVAWAGARIVRRGGRLELQKSRERAHANSLRNHGAGRMTAD